ncbi:MAG TPA: TIGR00730 family Rossman fold protein [Blastocatellia bacterium]|nr:TIGR00730 family Rossman fold protein [Blastocatellia bacterium]HMX29064.1 TIGR00730 family Rossman fold protein [Blastocatellia bacterium]HMY73896.1 TIGR00730 family Rossman fold protein [Blastocatellia bacterium]HMZ21015.1 TIGR00730 family Rossman fold protein [Blastocatellia bacterium]HNG34398.1 TIGR00730 family Rossman fold protein [Blastocatellia bacterium]
MKEVKIERICVFCGSSSGKRAAYVEQARLLGKAMAAKGIGLVYGAGGIGLMGEVANAVLEAGGNVTGIIPYALATKERANPKGEMRVVNTMHERKAMMANLSDAFIAMPGGFGTFEELMEIITWGQLGIHQKPIGLLNVAGYYDPLLAMIDRAVEEGFILPRYRNLIVVASEAEELLEKLFRYEPLEGIVQWIEMSET